MFIINVHKNNSKIMTVTMTLLLLSLATMSLITENCEHCIVSDSARRSLDASADMNIIN